MGNSNFINPNDPPQQVQGTLPAQPGYVTNLQGDPNGPPVNYRSPNLAAPTVQPQQDPMSGLPQTIRTWLQNDAVRAMVQQHIHELNRQK